MEKMNGIEATEKILDRDPNAKILLITTFQDDEYISSALSLGCKGLYIKTKYWGHHPCHKCSLLW